MSAAQKETSTPAGACQSDRARMVEGNGE